MMIAATRRMMMLRARLLAVVLALVATLLGTRPAPADYIDAVTGFSIVSRLTGASSLNQTNLVGIGGTDLGHMVNHQGKTYFLFGDTFSGDTPDIGGDWRHNAMAWSTDTQPANGILFDDWLRSGATAREVIHSGIAGSITEIPTGAVSIGNRIYAWYMAVDNWGPPSQWTIQHAGLASWSVGDPQFTTVPGFQFPSNSNFGMVAASFRPPAEGGGDDHLYVWGTPPGRYGGVKLARVLPDQVGNLSAYVFFDGLVDGQPVWTASEFDGVSVVPASVGEMSVMYNQAAGQWTMMYLNGVSANFELRQAPHPWGPWSSPFTVTTSAQAPGLYAPYMNPLYVENGGQTIYFTMSLWVPYDVYLAKATLRIVPEPIPGDIDGDTDIDLVDYGIMTDPSHWLKSVTPNTNGDLNGSGFVDLLDFTLFKPAYLEYQGGGGGELPVPGGVPEPSGLALAVLGTLMVLYCRRFAMS